MDTTTGIGTAVVMLSSILRTGNSYPRAAGIFEQSRVLALRLVTDGEGSNNRYRVKKLRAAMRKAVSFWVKRSRFVLSKLRLTSTSNLFKASFSLT